MANNWANFLNRASEGYGTGFRRYEQYADARDKRLNRADMQSVLESQRRLEEAKATPHATSEMVYEAAPVSAPARQPSRGTDGGPTPSAVDTTPPVMLDADPARRDTLRSSMGYADGYMTPPPRQPAERDPVRGAMTLAGVTAERQQAILDRGKQAEREAGVDVGGFESGVPLRSEGNTKAAEKEQAVAIEESGKKGQGKTTAASAEKVANEILGEVVLQQGPNKGKVPLQIDTTEYRTDTPTAEIWNNIREKMMAVAIRNGDYESVLAMPEKIAGMQQQGFLRNMEQAMNLQDDPAAMAAALTKAYSYYPDGNAVQFRTKGGQLYGYGYDEATGKFQGGTKIDGQAIASAMERAQDPVAFYRAQKDARLAAEQTAYDRAQDKKKYLLDKFDSESEHMLNLAQAARANGQAFESFVAELGGSSVGSWAGKADELHDRYNGYQSYIKDVYGGKTPGNPIAAELMNGGISSIAPNTVTTVGGALIAENGPGAKLDDSEVLDIASELSLLAAIHNGTDLSDATEDRQWEKWVTDRKEGKGPITNVVHDPSTGETGFLYNGRAFTLPSTSLRGLSQIPTDAQRAEQARNPEPEAVSGFTPVEGEALNTQQAVGVIGNRAADAVTSAVETVGPHISQGVSNSPLGYGSKAREGVKYGIRALGEYVR